jgi:hypothetical protein
MNHTMMNRALVIAAGLLLPTWAAAEGPQPGALAKANATQSAPGKSAALGKAGAEKGDGKDNAGSKAKNGDPAAKAAERAERRTNQHKAERDRLRPVMHGPIDDSLKGEMRRHAQRVARIERIKSLATDANDKDTTDRAAKLLDKESARHDKWMANYAATQNAATQNNAAVPPTNAAAPQNAATPPATPKAGAQ